MREVCPVFTVRVRPEIMERLHSNTEAKAISRWADRRARYWLTGLAIKARAAKLREYIGKITTADIDFLRHDPNIAEASEDLMRLSWELREFAEALSPDPEEVRLLADARERIEQREAAE
jgi:hypothetical protein